jgi:hypothetical protein
VPRIVSAIFARGIGRCLGVSGSDGVAAFEGLLGAAIFPPIPLHGGQESMHVCGHEEAPRTVATSCEMMLFHGTTAAANRIAFRAEYTAIVWN